MHAVRCFGLVGLSVAVGVSALAGAPRQVGSAMATAKPGKIVFSMSPDFGSHEVYVMSSDGSGKTRLTTGWWIDDLPAFSPDAKHIAFRSSRDGGDSEIYVMNADGSGQTRLTNSPGMDIDPAFSPDGKQIVFTSRRDDGNFEIYRMNADGSAQTRLTTTPEIDDFPAFVPSGKRIVFSSNRDGNYEIYRMNADGSGQTRLTTNPASDSHPAFSPDGKHIAFRSDRDSGDFEIYRMRADGSGQVNLTNRPGPDYEPAFSPDGRHVVFASEQDGGSGIYRMRADGSNPTKLTDTNLRYGPPNGHPSWGGRSASTVTVQARKAGGKVRVKGVLEPATVGNRVKVTLFVRQGGRWAKATGSRVSVTRLRDRDGDHRTDAAYRTTLERPAPGRYRVRTKFPGDPFTRGSTGRTTIPG